MLNNDNCSSESEGEYAPTILPLKKNKNGFASNYKVKKDKLKIKGEPAEIPTATKKDLKSINSFNVFIAFSFLYFQLN